MFIAPRFGAFLKLGFRRAKKMLFNPLCRLARNDPDRFGKRNALRIDPIHGLFTVHPAFKPQRGFLFIAPRFGAF